MNVLLIHTCTCILYTHISTVYIMLFKWNLSIHYSSLFVEINVTLRIFIYCNERPLITNLTVNKLD